MSDLGLTENVGSSGLKFEIWFRKLTGESWIVLAQNAHVKNRWVNAIENLLWTQALKNRESRLTDLSAMGVGNKPCQDLKESADNINDRFIPSFNKTLKGLLFELLLLLQFNTNFHLHVFNAVLVTLHINSDQQQ